MDNKIEEQFSKTNSAHFFLEIKFIRTTLRERTFFDHTFQVYHAYCYFILGYICWITVNFGKLKDGSLLISIFALNNCFSDRNIFQKGVDALSKKVKGSEHFILFGLPDYVQILLALDINTYCRITNGILDFGCQQLQR